MAVFQQTRQTRHGKFRRTHKYNFHGLSLPFPRFSAQRGIRPAASGQIFGIQHPHDVLLEQDAVQVVVFMAHAACAQILALKGELLAETILRHHFDPARTAG